jgi:hypothetical protein
MVVTIALGLAVSLVLSERDWETEDAPRTLVTRYKRSGAMFGYTTK